LAVSSLSFSEIGKSAGEKAVKVFNGIKAADISIDNAANSDVIINKATADKLGIDISGFPNATIVGE